MLLTNHKITTIISTFIMDSPAVSTSQLNLIRAAEASPTVTRFLPSEFNVEYNQPDTILPYPEKQYHLAARAELARTTTLEYAYIYTGMFMDYFCMPRIQTALRPLYFFFDADMENGGVAMLPGDGEGKMSMTFTEDAARYIAWALDLEMWKRGQVMTTAVETVSLNGLVAMVERASGEKLEVRYQSVEGLLKREPVVDLRANVQVAKQFTDRFPGGLEQVRALVADLEASVALGAYDFGRLEGGYVDLVKVFEGREPRPKTMQELLSEAWGKADGE